MNKKGKSSKLPIIIALIGVLSAITTTSLTIFKDDIVSLFKSQRGAARVSVELISDVTASSKLAPMYFRGEERTYDPSHVVDGRESTAWVEGAQGDGTNEWVKINFSKTVAINKMSIVGAYGADRLRYKINNRLKKAAISFSDGSSKVVDFIDSIDSQEIDFGRTVKTRWVKIEILEVYYAPDSADTPISEVYFE